MKKKKCLLNSVYTFVICAVFFNTYFYLKYGAGYMYVDDLMYGIPLWTLLLTYAAYGSTRYYYSQKEVYLPQNMEEDQKEYRMEEWVKYKKYILFRLLRMSGLMFGMAAPAYFLAYMEESEFLKSSPHKIAVFAVLAILSLAASELLRRNYVRYTHRE
jgi:fatty acid desaturase